MIKFYNSRRLNFNRKTGIGSTELNLLLLRPHNAGINPNNFEKQFHFFQIMTSKHFKLTIF